MRDQGCRQLAELRSAYLDDALADADRERVLSHLVRCPACRAEVEELRTVRLLLSRMGPDAADRSSPGELSSRLVSIAGQDAYVPVWSRPFRRTRPGALPSDRRRVRIRTTAAALAFGGLVSALGAAGYLAAPTTELTAVADPTDRVRSEFAATLTQLPLVSRSISALMMTPQTALQTSGTRPAAAPEEIPTDQPVTRSAAVSALRRAAGVSNQVSYSGRQLVLASRQDRTISATVQVSFEAGQGSAVRVFDRGGSTLLDRFVPAPSASRMVDEELLSVLLQNYAVSGWTGATVAGRPVSVVQAAADGPGLASKVAARWWIDDATGLLLWQETYDASGHVALAAGFTTVTVRGKPVFMEHLAPRLASTTTTASLTLSNIADLASRGWYCQGRLAGLSLVRLRSDEAVDPGALHMVYSDGVSTLSVFEQRGRLAGPPVNTRLDESLRAYVRVGTPTMATWRSGDRVFTVVTDGSPDLVRAAVAALPHQDSAAPTTMERVRAGWVRIITRVVG